MAKREYEEALAGLEQGPAAAGDAATAGGAPAAAESHASVAALRERYGEAIGHHTIMAGDEHVVYVDAARIREILTWLRDDGAQRYDLLIDLTAVDWGGGRPLEVVYQLWSIPLKQALRVKAVLPVTALQIDSVAEVYATANWLEREVYDLFGITFEGHPDLRRIMMPDNYEEGHPLRKDFPLRGRFSRAEQTRRALALSVEDHYTPAELAVTRDSAPGAGETEEKGRP